MSEYKRRQLKKLIQATKKLEQRDFEFIRKTAPRQMQIQNPEPSEKKNHSRWQQYAVAALLLLVIGGFGIMQYLQRDVSMEDPSLKSASSAPTKETPPQKYEAVYQTLQDAFDRIKEKAGEGPRGGSEFGETNVLVEGAEEADIVKYDGERLYTVSTFLDGEKTKWNLSVIDLETLAVLDRITLSGDDYENITGLFVEDEKLALLGVKPYQPEYLETDNRVATSVRFYDIAADGQLKYQHEWIQEGSYRSSVINADGNICLITSTYFNRVEDIPLTEDTVASYVPHVYNSATDSDMQVVPQENIHVSEIPGSCFYVISTIPMDNATTATTMAYLGAKRSVLYINRQNLYIQSSGEDNGGTVFSHIDRYALNTGGVKLEASGNIPGAFVNPYTVCEWGGTLRILARNSNESSTDRNSYVLYVLNISLDISGQTEVFEVEGFISDAQLAGQTGYAMTMGEEAIAGPSYGMDLRDPSAPKMTGALDSSRISGYFHALDETMLLNISDRVDESPERAGLKLSILNASDPADPTEISVLMLSGDCWIPGLYDRNAVLYFREQGLLALTVDFYGQVEMEGTEISSGGSQVLLFEISDDNGITFRAILPGDGAHRIVITDSAFYSITDESVIKMDAVTLEQIGEQKLLEEMAEESGS